MEGRNMRGGEQSRSYRDQLLTLGDLEIFKHDLIREIKCIIEENSASPNKKWLKSSEVKKLLGISTGTLQNLRVNGTLSHSKLGGTAYYDYEEIAKLLRNNEQR
jgi:hypothetical protein